MPYIYSLGYKTHETGAPYMRALFMDFPDDPRVTDLRDEYMFGPAFLVAPVTEQGASSRTVYLPAGTDWYNYWTHERLHGGQSITVKAPVETLPLFVRAGSIVPLGSPVRSTADSQKLARVLVYAGSDADFALYSDDGTTYGYESGASSLTRLHWDDHAHRLSGAELGLVEVVGK
jgi:alpha-D-xyloside xylohydrolase